MHGKTGENTLVPTEEILEDANGRTELTPTLGECLMHFLCCDLFVVSSPFRLLQLAARLLCYYYRYYNTGDLFK